MTLESHDALMNKVRKVPTAVLSGTILALSLANVGWGAQHELSAHIPAPPEVAPWEPSGASQLLAADDLPLHRPGVAETYGEYGFERAAFQTYRNLAGRTLRLEIYETAASDGAYGLYTLERREGCEIVDVGDEACLSDRSLHVWKDRFLIGVVGADSQSVTPAELLFVARATCDTITGTAARPDIVALLPRDGLEETSIRYLRGSLALRSAYHFGLLDTFPVREGVGGRIGENTILLFRYSSEDEARALLPDVITRLSGPEMYRLFGLGDKDYERTETARRKFVLATESSFILVAVGYDVSALSNLLDLVRRRVASAPE